MLWGYLFLEGTTPHQYWYSGYTLNTSDNCVYSSWVQNSASGHFWERNLFTSEPSSSVKFNIYYYLLGQISNVTGITATTLLHLMRLLLIPALVLTSWWFIRLQLTQVYQQRIALLLVCFSAGFGWLFWLFSQTRRWTGPDLWQPESTTYGSMLWSQHFLLPLILMLLSLGLLQLAERQRSFYLAVGAGLCLLILSNIHGYDLIPLSVTWTLFVGSQLLSNSPRDYGIIARGAVAGLIALPGVLYMLWVIKQDTVFATRVAVPTLSPRLWIYGIGYGSLLLIIMLSMLFDARRRYNKRTDSSLLGTELAADTLPRDSFWLLSCWILGHAISAYLPLPYQRKLVMGWHFPLAILAGYYAYFLLRRLGLVNWRGIGILTIACAGSPIVLTFNAAKMLNDPSYGFGGKQFLTLPELQALTWIRENTDLEAVVQPLPCVTVSPQGQSTKMLTLGDLVPALTGRRVHAGHWGETPEYPQLAERWAKYLDQHGDLLQVQQRDFISESRVDYLLLYAFPLQVGGPRIMNALDIESIPNYLIPVYSTPDQSIMILRVDRERL